MVEYRHLNAPSSVLCEHFSVQKIWSSAMNIIETDLYSLMANVQRSWLAYKNDPLVKKSLDFLLLVMVKNSIDK